MCFVFCIKDKKKLCNSILSSSSNLVVTLTYFPFSLKRREKKNHNLVPGNVPFNEMHKYICIFFKLELQFATKITFFLLAIFRTLLCYKSYTDMKITNY